MAKLTKKIYMTNSAGTQQTAALYSTTAEVGTNYANLYVDSTNCYVPLVSTSATTATSGRVIKNNTTYAIGSNAEVAYASKVFKTAGSGTFTVPNDVYKLRVTCVGGGAGGSSFFVGGTDGGTALSLTSVPGKTHTTSVGGSKTTFGTVTANGGTNTIIKITNTSRTVPDDGTYYAATLTQGSKGYNNGIFSTSMDVVKGGNAVPMVNISGTTIASVGAGGYADQNAGSSRGVWFEGNKYYDTKVHSGASGYRTVQTIDVTPGQVISYTVGGGGKWYGGEGATKSYKTSSSSSSGAGGAPGSSGGILVEYGKGIQ